MPILSKFFGIIVRMYFSVTYHVENQARRCWSPSTMATS